MKTFRFILSTVLILTAIACFNSCESDSDEETQTNIVGIWETEKEHLISKVNDKIKEDKTFPYAPNELILKFMNNGSMQWFENGNLADEAQYTVADNKIIMVYEESDTEVYEINSITKDEMIITITEESIENGNEHWVTISTLYLKKK